MQDPTVSVCVITYNQENYIKQCLDSIIIQKTNFDFEIVIGEDCSLDSTATIVKNYANSNSRINFLNTEKNLGVIANFIRSLRACKGKYIAFCEGDDYWIDENKLQKQVDFLELHTEYGGVCTNNRWFLEDKNTFKDSILEEGIITLEDLVNSNKINSQTILFRKELIKDLNWLKSLNIGDWPLHLLITSQQPYYRLPEITTIYRVHEGGVHSLLKEEFKIRNRVDVLIAVLKSVNITNDQKDLLKSSIKKLLKQLIGYNAEDTKTIRKKYFEYGGTVFNKTLLKSYIK